MERLLEENLPVKLKLSFSNNHEVITVREMGWTGKKKRRVINVNLDEVASVKILACLPSGMV